MGVLLVYRPHMDEEYHHAAGADHYPIAPRAAFLARFAARFSSIDLAGCFLVCFLLFMPLLIDSSVMFGSVIVRAIRANRQRPVIQARHIAEWCYRNPVSRGGKP